MELLMGWEFLILNPFDKNISQSSQKLYNKNYNNSYNKFIEGLCIPNPRELFNNDNLFTFYIHCGGDSDKIELEENFPISFLKSIFLKTKYKSIKHDLEKYYTTYDIHVRNLYKSGDYIFLIIQKIRD
jgi:hypothetical protein